MRSIRPENTIFMREYPSLEEVRAVPNAKVLYTAASLLVNQIGTSENRTYRLLQYMTSPPTILPSRTRLLVEHYPILDYPLKLAIHIFPNQYNNEFEHRNGILTRFTYPHPHDPQEEIKFEHQRSPYQIYFDTPTCTEAYYLYPDSVKKWLLTSRKNPTEPHPSPNRNIEITNSLNFQGARPQERMKIYNALTDLSTWIR